ncbi:equistatin-like [Mytilus edulis]|uniref:equistatin-like n=1 Tax=Mytilus edulis TaxID=6550 RepID=UPI0039EE5A9B
MKGAFNLAVCILSVCYLFLLDGATARTRSYGEEKHCLRELKQFHTNSELGMVGGRKPVCDSEGNYAPKQCSGSQCYCVKEDGKQIEDFSVNRWEAEQQTCKCARSQAEYQETGIVGKSFRCTADGSYDEIQCTGSQCYCADEDGQQVGSDSVHIVYLDRLNC